MSQNTTNSVRCCYFKLTTCFGPGSGPSSGHKDIIRYNSVDLHCIFSLNKYFCELKMAQSRGRNMSVQNNNIQKVTCVLTHLKPSPYCTHHIHLSTLYQLELFLGLQIWKGDLGRGTCRGWGGETDVARQKVRFRYLPECVSVALGTQHATLMRHIVICRLRRYAIFFDISQTALFWKKKKNKATKLVCILLGISPASDCCMPTFRNTLSVPSS